MDADGYVAYPLGIKGVLPPVTRLTLVHRFAELERLSSTRR